MQVLRRNLDPKEADLELEFVLTMLQRLQELLDPTTAPSTAQGQRQPGGFLSQNLLPTLLGVCKVLQHQNIATKITSGSNKLGVYRLLVLFSFVTSGIGILPSLFSAMSLHIPKGFLPLSQGFLLTPAAFASCCSLNR